ARLPCDSDPAVARPPLAGDATAQKIAIPAEALRWRRHRRRCRCGASTSSARRLARAADQKAAIATAIKKLGIDDPVRQQRLSAQREARSAHAPTHISSQESFGTKRKD